MKPTNKVNLLLSISQIKEEFSFRFALKDLSAGLIVTCVALPLSLALSLASGVDPAAGIMSSVLAGILCATFGGTALAISGPSNAMPLLTALVVQKCGVSGLSFLILCCGILQLVSGRLGFGRFVRFTPLPVVYGFTAGIGALLLVSQLPRALGLPASEENHSLKIILHTFNHLNETEFYSFVISLMTLAIVFLFPKVTKKIPATLLAVILPSYIAYKTAWEVPKLDSIPKFQTQFLIPSINSNEMGELLEFTAIAFILMTLESLLSTLGVERMTQREADPDRELLGQGLANIASGLFGGLPITTVMARSVLNVESGAKTRWASIFHSIFLLLAALVLTSWIKLVPVAVLAGLILSVGIRMLYPREVLKLWQVSRSEAFVTLATFLTILLFGLISGVQVGLACALVFTAYRLGRSSIRVDMFNLSGLSHLSIQGPLTFMSAATIEGVKRKLAEGKIQKSLIVDFSNVKNIDSSGATQLLNVLNPHILSNKVVFYGLQRKQMEAFTHLNQKFNISEIMATSDNDVFRILQMQSKQSNFSRIHYGVERFKSLVGTKYATLFSSLAKDQNPHTLFITCCDSRIDPNLITNTDPGELFVLRNIGNLIPKAGSDCIPAEGAAIEFAITVLGVKDIVICGHSECGAIKSFLSGSNLFYTDSSRVPHISSWLKLLDGIRPFIESQDSTETVVKKNVVQQILNLKTFPIVQEKLEEGAIRIHGWYYDIGQAEVFEWDSRRDSFQPISSSIEQSEIAKA